MIDLNLLFHRHPAAIALFSLGVFAALSYLIALHPARELKALDAALGHASPVPPPDQVARGRAIYLREGAAIATRNKCGLPLSMSATDGHRGRAITSANRRRSPAPNGPDPTSATSAAGKPACCGISTICSIRARSCLSP